MTKRIVLAGLAGGVAMFVWTSVAHLVLPLGEAGVQQIDNDAPVLSALQASLGQKSGLYFFPNMGVAMDATREQGARPCSNTTKSLRPTLPDS